MRLFILWAAVLSLAATIAIITGSPLLAGAVGAPADNFTIPEIPTDNTTPDEVKPTVNFLLEGPSSQGKNAVPDVIAAFTSGSGHDNNRITAGDTWFLDIDINAPGWIYIYEYYPGGSNATGRWVAYKWHLKESGVWKLGPFNSTGDELEGEHLYRIWFYAGGQWTGEDSQSPKNHIIAWTFSRSTPALKIISFEINPPAIDAEESTLLFWEVQGASSVEITGLGSMTGTSGTLMIKPTATTTYVLTVRDTAGNALSQPATVTVRPLPFTEQAIKFVGNPVILIMAAATAAVLILGFVQLRRRQAARGEVSETLSIPAIQTREKQGESRPQACAKATLELPGGLEIRITGDAQAVGRADLARCLEIDQLNLISRQHFRITCRESQFYIEDLGSAGGTRLNGTNIRESGSVALKDDDLVEPAGAIKLRFRVL